MSLTSPVNFTAMNKALGTEAADMPHLLGDPADAAWAGTAERVNTNFGAARNYGSTMVGQMNSLRIPAAELVDAAVIVPATSWVIDFAYANTLALTGGRMVNLSAYLHYTGATVSTPVNGVYTTPVLVGTLVAALRPTMANYLWNFNGFHYYPAVGAYSCELSLDTGGALRMNKVSEPAARFGKDGWVNFSYTYVTTA